jgi:tRNA G10  N-methylase Trm11
MAPHFPMQNRPVSHYKPGIPKTLGYPTQKPVALLDRIVRASTNPGDVVLDAFCGCGTTLEAAQLLGRRWIGIDISQSALRVVENRLRKIGAPPADMHGMVESEAELHELSWQEFQNWAVDAIQGRHSPRKAADMGIDGFTFLEHHPIQVKQMDAVGRPVIDSFVGTLKRQKDKRGIVIAFGFTKGAIGEVARLLREDALDIELVTCKQLIEEEIPFRKLA